jgi:hypothetical protein
MFASGPTLLSALCLIQAEADIDVVGRFETRVGQAPTGAVTTSGQLAEQSQVIIVATPVLGLRWLEGVDNLRANSATRILWRPVPLYNHRPLFLESLDVAHIHRSSKRSQWQWSLTGSYGEQDYTSLSQQFANQPALPNALTALIVSANGETLWRSSRRTTLSLQMGALYRRPVNAPTTTASDGSSTTSTTVLWFPTQTAVMVTPSALFGLSRRSSLELSAPLADYDIQGIAQTQTSTSRIPPLPGLPPTAQAAFPLGHANYAAVEPQLSLLDSLTRRHRLHVVAGLTYAVSLRGAVTSRNAISPIAQVELNSLLMRTRASTWRSSIGAGTTWFADPILGQSVQRGNVQARVDAELGPNWTAGLRMAFVTDMFGRMQISTVPPPDEAFRSVDLSVRRRWANAVVAELGARYAERAPYLSPSNYVSNSEWHNRELWAFLILTTEPRRPARPM